MFKSVVTNALSASHVICVSRYLCLALSASYVICVSRHVFLALSASCVIYVSRYLRLTSSATHVICDSRYLRVASSVSLVICVSRYLRLTLSASGAICASRYLRLASLLLVCSFQNRESKPMVPSERIAEVKMWKRSLFTFNFELQRGPWNPNAPSLNNTNINFLCVRERKGQSRVFTQHEEPGKTTTVWLHVYYSVALILVCLPTLSRRLWIVFPYLQVYLHKQPQGFTCKYASCIEYLSFYW